MLLRHHEDTRKLETAQQKAVHELRTEQILTQHETELQHQDDYGKRAESDLRKRHAMQLRQQPKSLKVSVILMFFNLVSENILPNKAIFFLF